MTSPVASIPLFDEQFCLGTAKTAIALSRAACENKQRRGAAKRQRIRAGVRAERRNDPDVAVARHMATRYPPKAPKAKRKPGGKANKWRVQLGNSATGETRFIDSEQTRIRRMQARITAWRNAIPIVNRRMRRILAKKKSGPRFVMLTLTYKDVNGWEPNHIREFMLALRKKLKSNLWAYAWVAEMQDRGAIHYHVMAYVAPGTDVPMPDKCGMWDYGMTRRETAKKGPLYIMSYIGKEKQKRGLPHGARMFAVWISKKIATSDELLPFRLSSAPPFIQEALLEQYAAGLIPATVRWRRRYGGGWVVLDTGEFFQSDWSLVSCDLMTGLEAPPKARALDAVPDDVLMASLYDLARSQQSAYDRAIG